MTLMYPPNAKQAITAKLFQHVEKQVFLLPCNTPVTADSSFWASWHVEWSEPLRMQGYWQDRRLPTLPSKISCVSPIWTIGAKRLKQFLQSLLLSLQICHPCQGALDQPCTDREGKQYSHHQCEASTNHAVNCSNKTVEEALALFWK